MTNKRKTSGFTLIELLLVVVILGILAALVVPSIIGRADDARLEAAHTQVKTFDSKLDEYQMHIGSYPSMEDGLGALIQAPASLKKPEKWKGPYIKATEIPLDPWDNEYQYRYPSEKGTKWPDVFSMGPDGTADTEDDIYPQREQ